MALKVCLVHNKLLVADVDGEGAALVQHFTEVVVRLACKRGEQAVLGNGLTLGKVVVTVEKRGRRG
jgi:hypothetical protein